MVFIEEKLFNIIVKYLDLEKFSNFMFLFTN